MSLIPQFFAVLMVGVLGVGCTTGLNSMQKQEYMEYQANGVLVEEKSPGGAQPFETRGALGTDTTPCLSAERPPAFVHPAHSAGDTVGIGTEFGDRAFA